MRITECYIENFGKLSSAKYKFNDGLNTVLADNGEGKSTLAAFIFSVFYGLSDTRKTSLDENDRKKYMPWGGGAFGGSLTFEAGGRLYRIERFFGKKASEDTCTLYDAKSGRACDDFGDAVIGEALFGIDADGFLRTVFLSEKTLSEKNENKSISAKLSGVTGIKADIGELDRALEILEEQRRLYYKKGGCGIILDTKSKVAELDSRIAACKEKERELPQAEAELRRIESELESIAREKSSLDEAQIMLERDRNVRNYRVQYENMRKSLAADEEKYSRLSEFFKNGKPTYEEIDCAAHKQLELEHILRDERSFEDDAEKDELEQFFKNGADAAEIDRMYDLALKAEELRDGEPPSIPREFSKRIPSEAELDGETDRLMHARAARSKRRFAFGLVALAAVLLGIGAIVGARSAIFLYLISAAVLSAVLSAVIFTTDRTRRRREKAEARAADFIFSLSGIRYPGDSLEILGQMKTALLKYKEAVSDAEQADERRRLRDSDMHEVYDFLSRFPAPNAKTPLGAVTEIREKHRRLEALTIAKRRVDESLSEKKRSADSAMKEAQLFLSRFETSTDRPFDEIRDKLSEFNSLSSVISRKRRELDDFAHFNGINAPSFASGEISEAGLGAKRKAADERFFALSREKILLERRIESYRADIESIAPLTSERNSLSKSEEKYESNLDIIQKTKKYLTLASEEMTKRYLGKTKESFEKYIRAIGRTTGEFALDTDFTLTKYEGAAARKSESYSKGTRDLYAIALRLALNDSLYSGELPFLIFDDPFMSLDDRALDGAKSALKLLASERQIIYFTCSRARAV